MFVNAVSMETGLQECRGDLERTRAQEGVAPCMEALQEHAKEADRALADLRSKTSEQEKMLSKGEDRYVSSKKT